MYGYVGAAMELFSDLVLKLAPGPLQESRDWPLDDPKDTAAIQIGIDLWRGPKRVVCTKVLARIAQLNLEGTGSCKPCPDIYVDTPVPPVPPVVNDTHELTDDNRGEKHIGVLKLLQTEDCFSIPPLADNPDVDSLCWQNNSLTGDDLLLIDDDCTIIPEDFCQTSECGCKAYVPGGYPNTSIPAPPVTSEDSSTEAPTTECRTDFPDMGPAMFCNFTCSEPGSLQDLWYKDGSYTGNVTDRYSRRDIYECTDLCVQKEGCYKFVYNTGSGFCVLYNNKTENLNSRRHVVDPLDLEIVHMS
eukprot:TRINITY_DN4975_c0_g1_i1.p1 TRINITY_DN4975_c0_g1~~TRINITY_DN4975_c0_g1_i1.p1  ORF type:complete len:301 (+),score=57.14 TRINITY_DN4975_c0_g1_i1:298-1200(+)